METKHAEKIKQATALMDKAREWFGSDMSGQPALTSNLIGQMDVRLVMFVHGFKIKTRVAYLSMDAICMDLAKEVRDKGGDMSKCPWKVQNAGAPAASAPKESTIVEYRKDGSISRPQLKTVFGMELGTTVTLKHPVETGKDALVYHIGKMDGAIVTSSGRVKTLAIRQRP